MPVKRSRARIGTSRHGPGQRHDRFARVLVADPVRDRYAKRVYRHPPSRARKRFAERPEHRLRATILGPSRPPPPINRVDPRASERTAILRRRRELRQAYSAGGIPTASGSPQAR